VPELWYRLLLHAATRTYYRRVRVVRLTPLKIGDGSVLFVGLHRNGAVDGMLYKSIFPRAVFVIAKGLLRSRLARLYFTGIPVTREHDDGTSTARQDNARSLATAVEHLASGGQLFILPEGTSDLGPRHLPFKPGVAKVLAAALERGIHPLVVPMGIFYDSAPSFRSDVCIVIGAPIDLTLAHSLGDRPNRIAKLMRTITESLEGIAVEAADAGALHRIETLAAIADDEPGIVRWKVQRMLMGANYLQTLDVALLRLMDRTAVDRAGVPRFSRHGVLWNTLWVAVQLPIVVLAALANLPPLMGAWLAGRRLADAPNTIALWRIIVGAPLAIAWFLGVVALGFFGHVMWVPPAYVAITCVGLVAYPELCVRWPMLRNALAPRTLAADIAAIRQSLLTAVAERSHG
jgi:hypothetical protein